jgi:hypothetical protein
MNESFEYRRNLSQPLSDLLADPLSPLTRTRQTTLLTAATVTLLLVFGLATVAKVSGGNAELVLSTPHVARWLAWAITLYLLIAYVLGVWADWAIAKAKRWSPLASIDDVKTAMHQDQQSRINADRYWTDKIDRLVIERDSIQAEKKGRMDPLFARSGEIELELSSLPEPQSTSSERRRTLEREWPVVTNTLSAAMKEFDSRLAPVMSALDEAARHLSLDPFLSMLKEQDALTESLKTFSTLTQYRLILEVVFPVAYGLLALLLAMWHR